MTYIFGLYYNIFRIAITVAVQNTVLVNSSPSCLSATHSLCQCSSLSMLLTVIVRSKAKSGYQDKSVAQALNAESIDVLSNS